MKQASFATENTACFFTRLPSLAFGSLLNGMILGMGGVARQHWGRAAVLGGGDVTLPPAPFEPAMAPLQIGTTVGAWVSNGSLPCPYATAVPNCNRVLYGCFLHFKKKHTFLIQLGLYSSDPFGLLGHL